MKQKTIPILSLILLLSLTFVSAQTLTIDDSIASLYNGYGSYYTFSYSPNDNILYGQAYVGVFPTGEVYTIRNRYVNGTATGLSDLQIGDLRGGSAWVNSLNNWYAITDDGTVTRRTDNFSIINTWSGYGSLASITADNQYIYLLGTNKQVRKYDFSMNLIENMGEVNLDTVNVLSDIDYIDDRNAFLVRTQTDLQVYDNNLNQYGENHTLDGSITPSSGMENNGTHLFISTQNTPKSIYFYDITNITPEPNTSSFIQISRIAPDIPLTSINGSPFSHAQDNTYNYILSDSVLADNVTPIQLINRFSTNFNFVDTLCGDITSEWSFIGKHEDNLLLRGGDNDIHQLDESCNPIYTQTLSGITTAGDLKVIDGQMYVITDEGRVIAYSVAENPNGILSYIYQYEFPITSEITPTNSYITGYGNYLYILDSATRKIFRYDASGGFLEAFELVNWNFTSNPRDLFFYNNNFYLLAYEEQIAVQYQLSESVFTEFDLLGGVKYSRNDFCVSENYLCDDTRHYIQPNGEVIHICEGTITECPFEGTAGGCNEFYDAENILTGECGAISCSNECLQTGRINCTSLTTYTICGNYDADVCLEAGSILSCPLGQICVDGDGLAGCEAAPVLPNLLQGLSVSKNIQSTNAYEINQDGNTFFISSAFNTAYVEFNALTTPFQAGYVTGNTDYEEEIIASEYMTDSNVWDGDTSAIQTDSYGRLHMELDGGPDDERIGSNFPTTTGNLLLNYQFGMKENEWDKDAKLFVTIFDENGSIISEWYIEHDKDLFTLSVYESNNEVIGSLLFTDTGTGNNVYGISIDLYYLEQIDSLNYQFNIFREVNNEIITERYFTTPFALVDNTATRPSRIYFHAEKDKWDIYGYELRRIPNFNNYVAQDLNNDLHYKFEYTTLGCRTARIYANEYVIPTYHFYDEFQICVVQIGEDIDEALAGLAGDVSGDLDALEALFGEPFSNNEKALIAILSIVAIFGVFAGIYFQTNERLMLYAGTITGSLAMFGFILFGYLPAWLFIIAGIIGIWVATRRFIGD